MLMLLLNPDGALKLPDSPFLNLRRIVGVWAGPMSELVPQSSNVQYSKGGSKNNLQIGRLSLYKAEENST